MDAYKDIGGRATQDAYRDIGGRTTQDAYRDIGGRTTQEQLSSSCRAVAEKMLEIVSRDRKSLSRAMHGAIAENNSSAA